MTLRCDGVEKLVYLIAVAGVASIGCGACFVAKGRQFVGIARRYGHRHALACAQARQRRAQTTARANDQCNFLLGHVLPSVFAATRRFYPA